MNLLNSFPTKSEIEINLLTVEFYKFLSDLVVETIKMIHISKKQIQTRCTFETEGRKVFEELFENKKSVIIAMGHYGNWEWANASMALEFSYQLSAIYRPLENPYFDKLFKKIRSKFGSKLVPMNAALRSFIEDKSKIVATAFLSDQTAGPGSSHWLTFLNQDTPVYEGPEKLAKKFNQAVIFCFIDRIARGYYVIHTKLISDGSANEQGFITRSHTKELEIQIQRKPELWLWSHNKWKHTRNGQNNYKEKRLID